MGALKPSAAILPDQKAEMFLHRRKIAVIAATLHSTLRLPLAATERLIEENLAFARYLRDEPFVDPLSTGRARTQGRSRRQPN